MIDERREKADQLLREANVLRVRGQYAEAETRCRAALELVPDDVSGMEMLAGLLHDKGSLTEARDLYQRVLEIRPGRAAAETKLARVTLEIGEQEHQRLAAQALLGAGTATGRDRKRRVTIAFLLSVLFAGAGQFYNGEYFKAALLGTVFLVGMAFGGPQLLALIFQFAGVARNLPPDTGWRAVLGFVAVFAWIYSILDAPARAQQASTGDSGLI